MEDDNSELFHLPTAAAVLVVAVIVGYVFLTVLSTQMVSVSADDPQQWCDDHNGEFKTMHVGYASITGKTPTVERYCTLPNETAVFFNERAAD